MKLYLVRHGEAKKRDVDPERGLTEQGAAEVKKVAELLRAEKVTVGEIRHSAKKRAEQTAEILAAAVAPGVMPETAGGLDPNDPVKPLGDELSVREDDLMIVGHLPYLPRLAALLLVGNEESRFVAFREASVHCLERLSSGSWTLNWMIAPKLA